MDGYLLETSVLSALLDPRHSRHDDAYRVVGSLTLESPKFVSVVALGELTFGLHLIKIFERRVPKTLEAVVEVARSHSILEITRHTATSYGELKAILAEKYLAKANRRGRRRYLEDWVDKNTGQILQIDENDLWMCAQARERNLVLVTADNRIARIARADSALRLLTI